jgi:protein phosphatase
MTRLRAAAATDAGRVRTSNQDRALIAGDVVVVADGMGGHAGGEVAAATAVKAFEEAYSHDPSADGLSLAAAAANREVFARAEREQALHGMGTTLTAAALVRSGGEPQIALVNIGDSRAYLYENHQLRRLTEDHSLVEEMVRRGEITPEAALTHPHRHILTRALGIDPGVEIDSWLLSPIPGSRLLLCSDGLTNECSEAEIAEVLEREHDPGDAARELVARALGHGGSDNITVIVADVDDTDEEESPSAEERSDALVGDELDFPPSPPSLAESGEVTTAVRRQRPPVSATAPTVRVRATGAAHRQHPPRARTPRPTGGGNRSTARSSERIVTVRVFAFTLVLVALLGGIAGFVIWFNRATYFVGIANSHVAIFEGRPGGFLWFHPTLVETTPLAVTSVLPANVSKLREGILESSYDGAQSVVQNLDNERSLLSISRVVVRSAILAAVVTTSAPAGRVVRSSTSSISPKSSR